MADDVEQVDPAERAQLKCFADLMPLETRQRIERQWNGVPADVADEHGNVTNYVIGREGRNEVTLILLDRMSGPPGRQRMERIGLITAKTGCGKRQATQAEINVLIEAYGDMDELERDSSRDSDEVIVYGVPRVTAAV